MTPFEAECEVYSPRWGHPDTYRFAFSMEQLEISHGPRKRTAIWDEDGNGADWKGGTTLNDIMGNDNIHAPEGTENLIAYVWAAWRNGELSSEKAQEELNVFIEWINASTKAKPRTDFWRGIF